MYQYFFKNILDFFLALFGLIALFPIFVLIFLILWVDNKNNPLFFQWRLGKDDRIFKIIKFKTMNDKRDSKGNLLPDEERLTKIGSFIRKTSLDEIPQLFNVIKGDMSLIGPRPLLPYYLHLYNDFQRRRNEVKPGITGWAQVNGRNNLPWKKRFELDVWYVDNIGFCIDIKILFYTIFKVLMLKDVNEKGYVTSREFKGNDFPND